MDHGHLHEARLSPSKNLFFCFNESPSKKMKNAFCLLLMLFICSYKLFSVLRYLNLCSFLIMQKDGLTRKLRLISKVMTSSTGKQLQYTYCQEAKAIKKKLGEITEYNVRNIFFINHAKNEAGRLVLDLFIFLKKLYMSK